MDNISVVTVFTLSGLNHTIEHRRALFCISLLFYLIILLVNAVVIVSIIMDKSLHEPMYIFLCSLFISGLYGTAGFYPKFLFDLLSPHVISYAGCLLQGFVIHSAACCDLSILALMAYDRYEAICRPLVYHTVMTKSRVFLLVFFSWFLPLSCMFMNTVSILNSQLCGSHISRLYCVNYFVIKISCSRSKFHTGISYFNILFYFGHFFFIFWSYVHLIRTCQTSKENMGKFMQTCVPHLISLFTFAFALLLDLMYIRFGSSDLSQDLQNFMAIEFLIVPPILNPLIYGFKFPKIRIRILSFVHAKERICERGG